MPKQNMGSSGCFWILILCLIGGGVGASAFACNWGTRTSHPLPPDLVVKLLKENGFNKVKLFEADPGALQALAKSGIQVMLGIPNEFLEPLANSVQFAITWVAHNVSAYVTTGVDIRHVAVGNEPFLKTYKDLYLQTTLPALQNVQAALIKAGLGKQVTITVPLNADVYETATGLPSGGNFRQDIRDLMLSIVSFLATNASPLTINIYPFLSLESDPHFPKEYAFFGSQSSSPVMDGQIAYTNVFEANFDTLVTALEANGFGSVQVIVGEMGWPTDGHPEANARNAQRFNLGLVEKIVSRRGTPKRPLMPEVYLFALTDEDQKSVDPGKFERHWGLYNFDGSLKYDLDLGGGKNLVPARGVRHFGRQWCVMSPRADVSEAILAESISYACTHADCTSLGYGSSCETLDARGNASYAFNMYYQTMDQRKDACRFGNLAMVTTANPSPSAPGGTRDSSCRFDIMIDIGRHELAPSPRTGASSGVQNDVSFLRFGVKLLVVMLYSVLVG